MLTHLPTNTDFYSSRPCPYPGVKLPSAAAPHLVFPVPSRWTTVARESCQLELVERLTVNGDEIERKLSAAGAPVPEHSEGYALAQCDDRMVLASRSRLGLCRGRATLEQLGGVDSSLAISDAPATEIRFLGGWALWRTHGLATAIEIARAFKANRVLYNGWGWIPGDKLTPEDAWFVSNAREHGIELVFELRRMSFGREYKISEAASRHRILECYERAADCGFRSFGLLFDDVPWETADDECRLAADVLERVHARTSASGGEPELFVCPQFYWYPGQMDGAWKGRAGAEETIRQREYLETYGRLLPSTAHVYIANFWGDHPERYESELRAQFTELVRRKPTFFDNQLINDYRHGAIYPFALHSRPKNLGYEYAGYYLNCGLPISAYAAPAATALGLAWNPADYNAEEAMGSALRWLHGARGDRAVIVARGLNRLQTLANAWAGGNYTAVSHYATLWRQIHERKASVAELDAWRAGVRAIREDWVAAIRAPAPDARRESLEGLLALVRDSFKLECDLELFHAYASSSPASTLETKFDRARRAARDAIGAILPPAPGLEPLLRDPSSLPPLSAQAWSWVEYFFRNTEKSLGELRTLMISESERPG